MPGKQSANKLSANAVLPDGNNGTAAFLLKYAPVIILAITALLYSKAPFNDFVSFDDYQFILKNKVIRDTGFDAILKIFTTFNTGKYQPVTTLSYVLEYRFFGFSPFVFHITNIIFHLLSTLVVFKIAEHLSGSRVTATVVALLFGIHPMHVEEVAWVSERKDMLYAFFYLCAIYAYLRYGESGYRIKYYIIAFFLFLISLFSKTEAISLPLVLIIIDVYKNRKITVKVILEKAPMFLFSFFIGTLGFLSQQTNGFTIEYPISGYGFFNRIFLAATVPAFYIVRLFAPFNLSAEHYYPDMHHGMLPWAYYASLPFMLLMIWLVCRRSSFRREKVFGSFFFLTILFFMPQVVFAGPAITPERYSYLPYIGVFYIIGQWATIRLKANPKSPLIVVFTGFTILFCVLTWQRINVWKNSITLYTDMVKKNNDIHDLSYVYWMRGTAYADAGDLPAAIEDYNKVVSLQPLSVKTYKSLADVNFKQGNLEDAIADFDSLIRLSPGEYINYCNRAAVKASAGDFNGALSDYNLFLGYKPDDDVAYTARGAVRLSLKDSAGACDDWKKAATLGNHRAAELTQQYCH